MAPLQLTGETMNLELDFKFSKQNPNIEKYSQCPIEFRTRNLILLKNWVAENETISSEYPLCDIDSFFDLVDEKEFAKVTSMEYVRKFNEQLERFERYWGDTLRRISNSDYRFETKKNYDWKNGIYDVLKKAITHYNGFHMRNSGIDRLFIRVQDSRYPINGLAVKFQRLEQLRKDCKTNVGKVIDNIEEVIELQKNKLKAIQKSTDEANQMSPNYDVYNAINFGDVDLEPPYNGFLKLKLYTIVVMHPNMMNIVRSNGDLITRLPVPKSYLIFERQLSKVLLGKPDKSPRYNAATPGHKHPYIATSQFYNLETTDKQRYMPLVTPWSYSLCLSAYSDDIIYPLANNDYQSFIMGISAWNNIYNNENTNPHNAPSLILQDVGIDKDLDVEDIQTLQSFLSFRTSNCWEGNLYRHSNVEDDDIYARLKTDMSYDSYRYGDYVINDCNTKQCPLRDKCDGYSNYVNRINSPDFKEMIESWAGWHFQYAVDCGDYVSWDEYYLLKDLHKQMHYFLGKNGSWKVEMFSNLDSYGYWTEPEKVSEEMKEINNDSLAQAVQAWTQSINS